MKESYKKKAVNYSIDKILLKEFDVIAKEKSTNKSALVENLIRGWVKEQKKK